ncbi:hypothetical protein L218DRAFT_944215 [Marasmius fiardii PR-910]|nr:hypothetical protein L218DRAFT_944215 [Marasmius fiardii PR-910]
MLARLSNTSIKALGLNFSHAHARASITASSVHSSSSDGDELVIDLDFLQLVRPIQDFSRLLNGCGKLLAPVWNNIQDTLSYDVERMALFLLEEGSYDADEVESDSTDAAEEDPPELGTFLTNGTQKSPFLYGERPPRIQRSSSYLTQPKTISNPDPSIPTITITPCPDDLDLDLETLSSSSECHVPIQDSGFNSRLVVPDHYPTYNRVFPPMSLLACRNPELELTTCSSSSSFKWRWCEGHWKAVLPELDEQVRRGLFSRVVIVKGRRRMGKGMRIGGKRERGGGSSFVLHAGSSQLFGGVGGGVEVV